MACVDAIGAWVRSNRLKMNADKTQLMWLVTGQLADDTVDFACLVFVLLAACETASCPVRDLSSPQVD